MRNDRLSQLVIKKTRFIAKMYNDKQQNIHQMIVIRNEEKNGIYSELEDLIGNLPKITA